MDALLAVELWLARFPGGAGWRRAVALPHVGLELALQVGWEAVRPVLDRLAPALGGVLSQRPEDAP